MGEQIEVYIAMLEEAIQNSISIEYIKNLKSLKEKEIIAILKVLDIEQAVDFVKDIKKYNECMKGELGGQAI